MLDAELVSFVSESLPDPPARLLEVGAGSGELAAHLTAMGYDVLAIDPAGETAHVRPLALEQLDTPAASFDAALAVVSLHHVEPLQGSCERLAGALRPGAPLIIDEFDVAALDVAAARWWLGRQPEHVHDDHSRDPETIVSDLRRQLHSLDDVLRALEPWFDFGAVARGPYLYRWELGPTIRPLEERAIARAEIAATGARVVGKRRRRDA